MITPLDAILNRFDLHAPQPLATTAIGTVCTVQQGHRTVVLKVYHRGDLRNEGPGLGLLAAWNGGPAVQILDLDLNLGAVVMEHLPGPALGDLSRAGRDVEATEHLATVAVSLHRRTVTPPDDLLRLAPYFAALLALTPPPEISDQDRRNLSHATALARHLLATEAAPVPLHGDLHHDNIRKGARGYTAFDAKGLFGEAGFELANAMRNPKGVDLAQAAQIRHRAARWSARLGIDRDRFLAWCVAKAGLSIAWQLAKSPIIAPDESAILDALCAELRAAAPAGL